MSCADFFKKDLFREDSFISVIPSECLNRLDPDQARHLVGPDLGPNCSQWL